MTIEKTIHQIQDHLKEEQQRGPLQGLDDLKKRQEIRGVLHQHIDHVGLELKRLREQVRDLPSLPPLPPILWAQAVSTFPNLVFLEVDTTGLYADAEVIHVQILDAREASLVRVYAQPSQPLNPTIERITGISSEALAKQAIPVAELLQQVRCTLTGKYVLSYNLDFDVTKLREAAERAEVEPLSIIGEDLMQRAMLYFGLSSYPKLEALCQRIGHPLPAQPKQRAIDRAQGQRALLAAMANVVMGATADPTPSIEDGDELDDLDEHPF